MKDLNDPRSWLGGHYYGDNVRRLFFVGAIIMLVALPSYHEFIAFPPMLSILAAVIVGIAAGFTSPKHKAVLMLDIVISLVAVIIFEYYAVDTYIKFSFSSLLLWINQALAIIFFLALYYSTKTLRGHVLSDQDES
jgi:hypothetical protein